MNFNKSVLVWIFEILSQTKEAPWWEICSALASGVSAVIAIIAIFMTVYSVRAQNKQKLFEMRMRNYVACKKFIRLFERAKDKLPNQKSNDIQDIASIGLHASLYLLTDCGFFENISNEYGFESPEYRDKLIAKVESINTIAEKTDLLFDGNNAMAASKFIKKYADLLTELYRHDQLINKFNKSGEAENNLIQHYSDLVDITKDLKKLYSEIVRKKILDWMKNETKLSKKDCNNEL